MCGASRSGRRMQRILLLGVVVGSVLSDQRCKHVAENGDHVLARISIEAEGNVREIVNEFSLYHFEIGVTGLMSQVVRGACPGDERKFSTSIENFIHEIDIKNAITLQEEKAFLLAHQELFATVLIRIEYITPAKDYQVIEALESRDYGTALKLVNEENLGINARDAYGMTTLMIAIVNKQDALTGTLLNAWSPRVDINAQNPQGYTALTYAIGQGTSLTIARALLKRGADPNIHLLQPQSGGWTPLHFAARLADIDAVQLLLDFNANPLALGFAQENVFDVAEQAQTPYAFRKKLANLLNAALDKLEEQFENESSSHNDPAPSLRDNDHANGEAQAQRAAATSSSEL